MEFLERHSLWVAVLALLLGTARIAATYHVFDNVADEPGHIAAGIEWLDSGKFTWEAQHPPLARVMMALGPFLAGEREQHIPHTDVLQIHREGVEILYHANRYALVLTLARLGILPFFWLAGAVVYAWGARYLGRGVGAVAAAMFSFLPPVLAHSGLATTDMALTATLAASFLAACVWVEKPTARNALWFGASTALVVLSKFSALVFFPAAAGLSLAWWMWRTRPGVGALLQEVKRRAPSFALAVAVGCVAIWAGYRFSFGTAPYFSFPVPAPELFQGIKDVSDHNARGHICYLLGQVGNSGFWNFYLVSLAVKTPLGFLALLAAGIAMVFRKRPGSESLWLPLAFSLAILAVGMRSRIHIGIRHVLPLYVGFSLLAAFAVVQALRSAQVSKWWKAAVVACCAWFAVSSAAAHPDYLAYFNQLGGSHPENILVDSDLDWGQDQKRLAARLRELGVTELAYNPYVAGDLSREPRYPPIHPLDKFHPLPGWNAMSVTQWKAFRLAVWPDRIPPRERVGKSLLLWYFAPGDGRLEGGK